MKEGRRRVEPEGQQTGPGVPHPNMGQMVRHPGGPWRICLPNGEWADLSDREAYELLSGNRISPEEWDAINARLDAEEAKLEAESRDLPQPDGIDTTRGERNR